MKTDVVDLFLQMARIVSPPGEEREIADLVHSFAGERGLDICEDDAGPKVGGDTGNLLIRIPGNLTERPNLMFCAHLDTVPVSGPIRPRIEDGYVHSDGTTILGADNKASVAAMLAAVDRILSEGRAHGPIELVFTVKEETGCEGSKVFDATQLKADFAYVYDHTAPVGAYVSSAPAGFLLLLKFHGRPAHAGLDPGKGRSAVVAASHALSELKTGRHDDGATINAGLIRGGTAHNIVPEFCEVSVDIRARTYERALEIVSEIKSLATAAAEVADCTVGFEVSEKYTDYRFEPEHPIVKHASAAINQIGLTPAPEAGGGGADANVFNRAGLPCLNLGSGMESVHTTAERIAVAELHNLTDLTLALIDQPQIS